MAKRTYPIATSVALVDPSLSCGHRRSMTSVDRGLGLHLFDDRYIQDPYPLYAQMHKAGPVHRIADSDFYAVSSWKAVNEAVARCSDFSSNLTATMMYRPDGTVEAFPLGDRDAPTQALATADDPIHAFHRKLLLPQLAAKRIRTYAQLIADTATTIWDSSVTANRVEWMSVMANRLPMMIVARIIGVPDEDTDKLARWGYAATQLVEGLVSPEEMEAALASALELGGYISEKFQYATVEQQDNLLGDLARATANGDLDDVAALTMMITLFSAGGESTASLIGSGAWILASRPDIQRRLREDAGLLGLFVEEVLRYEP
ncbi:MAG: cytochrome P450, partial [Oleiphilus sp.]